ncbi:MAG: HEAT repeat domain-containing protein [Promethearchaeota archaeon]
MAAESLGKLNDERAVDPLIEVLNDENSKVRSSAAFSLGRLRYVKAVDALIERLEDKDKDTRYAAIKALGEIGDKGAVRSLIKLFYDPDNEIRKVVIESLASLLNLRVLYYLYIALKDEDNLIRHIAARNLIKFGDLEIIQHIEDSLRIKGIERRRPRLLKVSSEMIFFWYNKAFAYLEFENYKKAILLFRKITNMDQQNMESWLSMGIAYFYLQEYRETIECFEILQDLGYENEIINDFLNNQKSFIHGKPSNSIISEAKERLKSLKLPLTVFWLKIGEKERELKNYEAAIKYFEKVIQIDPNNVDYWINLSSVYKDLNDFGKAIECLNQAIEIDNQNITAWFDKARLYGILIKDYPKAMNALNKIIEIDPNNNVALSALVKVQDKFENLFSDVFEIPDNDDNKEQAELDQHEIFEEMDIELVKDNLIKYSKIYKSIHLNKLAEKCRYPVSKIEKLLEELILNEKIKGYIANNYYIQDTMTQIEKLDRLADLKEIDKIKALDIRKIQIFLSSIDEIRLKELASKFEISLLEMESWLKELLDKGIISGEISDSKFIPLKKVNYDELDEYQLISGNLCAICYTNIETQSFSKCENCNTIFHKDCILAYVEQHKRCPVCSNIFRWI